MVSFALQGYKFGPQDMSSVEKAALTWHRITEAFKHAYAQRTLLGDVDVGSEAFKNYVQEVSMIFLIRTVIFTFYSSKWK